jgi:hypothetical protein
MPSLAIYPWTKEKIRDVKHSPILSRDYAHLHSGSIDIPWDDVCTLFGSVCVSWNPAMFKNQLLYHGLVPAICLPTFQLNIT